MKDKIYSDQVDGHNQIILVKGRQALRHTEHRTCATLQREFVNHVEYLSQLAAGGSGLFDFQWIQHTVALDDNVDLLAVLVSVIVDKRFFSSILIAFEDFTNCLVFQYCAVHCPVLQGF
jgi:hypothetical protein